ncbi:MAG: MMPL family transporter [Ilumatobacteraceae bacterium]
MSWLLSHLATVVRDRPRWVVAAAAALTVLFGVFAAQQTTDTELTAFAPDSEAAVAFDRTQEEFGGGGEALQVVIDAGPGGDVWSSEGLAVASAVTDALDGVIAESDIELAPATSFADPVRQVLAADGTELASATDAEIDTATAAAWESGAANLASSDADIDTGRAEAGLVIVNFPPQLTLTEVRDLSLELADATDGLGTDGVDVLPFNAAVLNQALQEESESEMPVLLGLSMLLILGILAFQYRTVSDVLIGIVGLVASITWMMGIAVLLGPSYLGLVGPFSQIATIVPVLIVGLGIDYAIHVTTRYREERAHGLAPDRSGAMAVRTVGGALVLATITTSVGFLTNLVSPLPPMGDFGVFTAVGVLSAFVFMTTVVPAARNLLDTRRIRRGRAVREHRPAEGLANLIGRTSVLAERAPRLVLAAALGISVLAAGAATQVSTTFAQDDFIPDGSPIDQLIDRVDTLFAGDVNETTFVLLDGDVEDPAVVAALDDFADGVAGLDDVRSSDGVARIDRTVAPDGTTALVSIATTASQDGAAALADQLDERLAPVRDLGVTATVTSEPIVIDQSLDALTASQTRGIVITLAAALALLVGYYGINDRKPVLGLITMIPSLAVVSWVLGTMWLLDISFNVLTAMVASLGIGIGVPFGIHITHRFLEDRRRYDTVDEAIRNTVRHTGGAMAGSAATTAGGFGVLIFASLIPIQQFGTIVAITIVYSFVAAVLIQPSCLRLWADHRARRGDHGELLAHEHRDDPERELVTAEG